jgi:hypothetical protein
MTRRHLTILVLTVATTVPAAAQTSGNGRPVPVVRDAAATDFLPALHLVRPHAPPLDGVRELPRKVLPGRVGSVAPDAVTETLVQESAPVGVASVVEVGFDGLGNVNGVLPPDPTGAIGPNHYVQAVNLSFAVYDRAGTRVYGPANTNTIWANFGGPCQTTNNGDPVVLYDRAAGRFIISQFALPNYPSGPFYECIAVSTTSDPLLGWYRYAFLVSNTKMNDYPKIGVWPDGYYMAVNQFNQNALSWGGAGVVVFERARMIDPALGVPRMIYFDLFSTNANLGGFLPADWDGAVAPPVGAPNVFAEIDDNAWGYSGDQIALWEFRTTWGASPTATFTEAAALPTSPFDSNMCGYARACITQAGTSSRLDAVADRLMFRLPYRNFGTHQSLVLNHTVDTNGADRAGIRWYELRDTGGGWGIHQQNTYAPADGQHRWMGSIAMNDNGDIALAYSVSGSTTSPSLRFTSRKAADAPGQMTQPETSIVAGAGYQTHTASRWGDYAHLSADPIDGTALWFTGEYTATASLAAWRTRIAKIELSADPPPPVAYTHVGDLDPSTTKARNTWTANVSVQVHDETHGPVANATVSATWSGGYSGGASCVTNASGTCTMSSPSLNNKKPSVTLTVTTVSHAVYSYAPGGNHDPDADSTGTAITVPRP